MLTSNLKEAELKVEKLGKKVEEHIKKEAELTETIRWKDKEAKLLGNHVEVLMQGLKDQIKELTDECTLKDATMDKFKEEKAKLNEQISEFTERLRDPTAKEKRGKIEALVKLFPFYVRKCALNVVTTEVKKRFMQLGASCRK
jgi:peptidoglycan hydrolase CwlO-like protein